MDVSIPLSMKILLITILALISLQLKAQTWVQVPDPNFQNYLTTHYPAGAFMNSGGNFFIDSDHPDVQNTANLNISGLNISSIDGISAFENLQVLECQNNVLVNLPNNIPDTLFVLNCSNNQLTVLPSLPGNLGVLFCNSNQLTAMPTLPINCYNVECAHNQLTQLPVIPASLVFIDCSYNQLTSASLTGLPVSLAVLACSNNPINVLPDPLPLNLSFLNCNSTQLTALPAQLPASLEVLKCTSNQLIELPVLPSTLQVLECGMNQLTELPNLPGLVYLSCEHNQLTSIPILPSTLQQFDCYSNQLDSLPDLPNGLYHLTCGSNQLTILPDLPSTLSTFSCDHNQLTILPELPAGMSVIYCDNNQLTELPELPDSLTVLSCPNNQISCFGLFPETLNYILLGTNPFTCLPNYIPAMDSITLTYPLCDENDPVNNPNGCVGATGIEGIVFYDVNNDCVSTGSLLTYVPMVVNDSIGNPFIVSTSLANGNYYFAAGPGNYELKIDTSNLTEALGVTCPAGNSSTATVPAADTVVPGGDFGLVCAGFDLGVQSIVPQGWVFPGQTHEISILAGDLTAQYNMHCASGIQGEVTVSVTGPGTVSFGGSPSNVSGNNAVYSMADFGAINANQFILSVLTDTTAVAGDEFCVTVSVATNASGELDVTNNLYSYCYHVVNSYDPNIKQTYPEAVETGFEDEFTYTIYFQNTGSAPAFNIRLADTLDANLDLTSFKTVNASHSFSITVNPLSRLLTVRFPNIMLPDSTSDPEGSIGFIQYRVKPVAGLTNGTIIHNTAYIYFDYNTPIVTNTSENMFITGLGLGEWSEETIQLYPNPAENECFIRAESEINQITLSDINGKQVVHDFPHSKTTSVDVSDLKQGVYIVKIQTNQSVVTKRLIVH